MSGLRRTFQTLLEFSDDSVDPKTLAMDDASVTHLDWRSGTCKAPCSKPQIETSEIVCVRVFIFLLL